MKIEKRAQGTEILKGIKEPKAPKLDTNPDYTSSDNTLMDDEVNTSQEEAAIALLRWFEFFNEDDPTSIVKASYLKELMKLLRKMDVFPKEPKVPAGELYKVVPYHRKMKAGDTFFLKKKNAVSEWTTATQLPHEWLDIANSISNAKDLSLKMPAHDSFAVICTAKEYRPLMSVARIVPHLDALFSGKKSKLNLVGLDVLDSVYDDLVFLDARDKIKCRINYIVRFCYKNQNLKIEYSKR